MRTKKLFALVITFVMMFALISVDILAVENGGINGYQPSISCKLKVNGDPYYGEDKIFHRGDKVTLRVEDVTYKGQTLDSSKVRYQWVKIVYNGSGGNSSYDIPEAMNSTYTFAYDGSSYGCNIKVTDSNNSVLATSYENFNLKEDTLTVTVTSDLPGAYDETGDYKISNVPLGKNGTLTVNASSTYGNKNISYEWWHRVAESDQMDEKKLSETSNVLHLTKGIGSEYYHCVISDGNVTKDVFFCVEPIATLTVTPTINGFQPKRFERGYMYVAEAGEKVTMKVDATSSNGKIEYLWKLNELNVETNRYEMKNLGTTNSETFTKRKETSDILGLGAEMYECYIKDGNELINVSFIVFSIAPDQVTTQIDVGNDVPTMTINNRLEELSNDLLKDDLDALQGGESAEVKLTAEKKDRVSENEQAVIAEKMSQDSNVGMYLDINLYKKVESDPSATQVAETQKEINISITVPEELINENEDVTRSYQIIRVHNGVAETLDTQYDAETESLTFNTNKFSTYVITYKEVKVDNSGNIGSKQPQTGDNNDMRLWISMLFASAFALFGVTIRNRKCQYN